jgi:thiol-disulfide isomerase/thioredoxin
MKKLLFLLALSFGAYSFMPASKVPVVGVKAPELILRNQKGKLIKLSKLKGKVVLIDFWASWCGPCRKENPNVVEAYSKYKEAKFANAKGFEVYSVSIDQDQKAWSKAIKEDKLPWKTHVIDESGAASNTYGVSGIPAGFLVDGEGMLVAKGQSLRGMGLHVEIEKLLKK